MTILHTRHALLPDGWAQNVDVEIAPDGRIGSVTSGTNETNSRDGRQVGILVPAMANLHSHSFQRAMAGRTEFRRSGRDSFWTWRELMYRFTANLTPEQIEAIANLATPKKLLATELECNP
jgi:cytosine/adenosine deaminase-related metal-dependent hydrolase